MERAIFLDLSETVVKGEVAFGGGNRFVLGAANAIASLRGLGYKIVVLANYDGVAYGKFTEEEISVAHEEIAKELREQANGAEIDRFYYCPFHPDGTVPGYRKEHGWRLPDVGMFEQAGEDLDLDIEMCWMVGSKAYDIEAGTNAGVRTVLLVGGKKGKGTVDPSEATFVARQLSEAVRIIAQQMQPEHVDGGDVVDVKKIVQQGKTYTANEELGVERTTGSVQKESTRPFKPWEIQPVEAEEEVEEDEVEVEEEAEVDDEGDDSIEIDKVSGVVDIEEEDEEEDEEDEDEEEVRVVRAGRRDERADRERRMDRVVVKGKGEVIEGLLGKILYQVKQRDARRDEFSSMKFWGLFMFILAVSSVLIGLFTSLDQPGVMLNWLVGGVVFQLMAITLLILHWQK